MSYWIWYGMNWGNRDREATKAEKLSMSGRGKPSNSFSKMRKELECWTNINYVELVQLGAKSQPLFAEVIGIKLTMLGRHGTDDLAGGEVKEVIATLL